MLRKIITYFLIIAVFLPVLAGAVPFGGKINRAQAEGATTGNSNNASFSSPCDFNPVVAVAQTVSDAFYKITRTEWIKEGLDWVEEQVVSYVKNNPSSGHTGGSVWSCASYTITYLLYEFVMKIAIWFVGLASNLFNISIQFALTGESFDADENTMIKDGWTLVRDLLNLVFIFILLFAAISTILQYGGFEIKKVLPGLIVAALLVNFSLMIAKMVIDASHIFAWEFYNQIDVTKGGTLPNMQDSIKVNKDFEKKNLASVFIAGFNPQQLLTGKGETTSATPQSPWKEVYKKAIDKGESVDSTLWRMIIIILLEITLSIFSAFILLAGAIMFVARVVVLWLVMIFSPLAFLSMILPSMGKYSQMWWSYLINQSFLAPAFLFMFMLATKFINSGFIDTILTINEKDDSAIVTGLRMGEVALIFFNFLIVGGILMACLIVARQLGGKTAEFGIKWAHKGKDLALGGAKKLAWSPARYGLRFGGGYLADKTLDKEKGWGEKRWAKTLTSIPGVGIGLRKLGTMKKADEDKAKKAAEKYAGTLSSAGRTSLEREIEGTKGVGGFAKRLIYTGPEGAFKPGKEGYEKVIAKKNEEKKEKDLYHESWAEIYNKTKTNLGEKDVTAKEMEERIKKGELGKMEEEIEIRRKNFDLQNEKKKEENDLEIKKKEREIRALEEQQAELYKEGKHSALKEDRINELEKEISTVNKLNHQITAIDKILDRHEKKVESYRARELSKSKPAEEKKEKETKSK